MGAGPASNPGIPVIMPAYIIAWEAKVALSTHPGTNIPDCPHCPLDVQQPVNVTGNVPLKDAPGQFMSGGGGGAPHVPGMPRNPGVATPHFPS